MIANSNAFGGQTGFIKWDRQALGQPWERTPSVKATGIAQPQLIVNGVADCWMFQEKLQIAVYFHATL